MAVKHTGACGAPQAWTEALGEPATRMFLLGRGWSLERFAAATGMR